MNSKEIEFVESYVVLDWHIGDFDSKILRYNFLGDKSIINEVMRASIAGKKFLAEIKRQVHKLSRDLRLDLCYETVDTQVCPPDGPWASIHFLSFGIETEDLGNTYAIQFISNSLRNMGIIVPQPLKFKLYYLPPLPIATTERGHIMDAVSGFTSIRNERIEINIYPPRNWENIFRSLVHEVLHIRFLKDSSISDTARIESKVNQKHREFFNLYQADYRSERAKIHKSVKDEILEKLVVFRKANDGLSECKVDFKKANAIIEVFRRFFDAVLYEKVRAVPI